MTNSRLGLAPMTAFACSIFLTIASAATPALGGFRPQAHLGLTVGSISGGTFYYGPKSEAEHSIFESLGIARMKITEGSDRTVITAVDVRNKTIAKLDLVHGSFIQTEFATFRGQRVQGRKLFVDVKGQLITWETIGFTDTTAMPALPPELQRVAAFLAEPHVRSVLEMWRIGWEPAQAPVSKPVKRFSNLFFTDWAELGTNSRDISGLLTAGTVRGFPIATCDGHLRPEHGFIISRAFDDEELVAQCCPPSESFPTGIFAVSVCPHSGTISTCGITAGACKACPGFPKPYSPSCNLSARFTGSLNDSGEPLYSIEHCDVAAGTPPIITEALPIEIWPPNREMRSFQLADLVTAVSACGNPLNINDSATITSITSSEPGANDFVITGNASFAVRADRDGSGNGRVYEVHFIVEDTLWGGQAQAVVTIRVPHDHSRIGKVRTVSTSGESPGTSDH